MRTTPTLLDRVTDFATSTVGKALVLGAAALAGVEVVAYGVDSRSDAGLAVAGTAVLVMVFGAGAVVKHLAHSATKFAAQARADDNKKD